MQALDLGNVLNLCIGLRLRSTRKTESSGPAHQLLSILILLLLNHLVELNLMDVRIDWLQLIHVLSHDLLLGSGALLVLELLGFFKLLPLHLENLCLFISTLLVLHLVLPLKLRLLLELALVGVHL